MEVIFLTILFNKLKIINFIQSIIKINKYIIHNLLISLNGLVSIIINNNPISLRQIISNKTNLTQSHRITQAKQDTPMHIQVTKSLNTQIKYNSMKIFLTKAMDTSKTFTNNQNTHNNNLGLLLNKLDFKDSYHQGKTK